MLFLVGKISGHWIQDHSPSSSLLLTTSTNEAFSSVGFSSSWTIDLCFSKLDFDRGNLVIFKGYCLLVGCGSICGTKSCEDFIVYTVIVGFLDFKFYTFSTRRQYLLINYLDFDLKTATHWLHWCWWVVFMWLWSSSSFLNMALQHSCFSLEDGEEAAEIVGSFLWHLVASIWFV